MNFQHGIIYQANNKNRSFTFCKEDARGYYFNVWEGDWLTKREKFYAKTNAMEFIKALKPVGKFAKRWVGVNGSEHGYISS